MQNIPAQPGNVRIVSSMKEFMTAKFSMTVNAMLLPRTLRGDFNALAAHLAQPNLSIVLHEDVQEAACTLGGPAAAAARQVLADIATIAPLCGGDGSVVVAAMTGQPAKRLHADNASGKRGQLLCVYAGAGTEWAEPADVQAIGPERDATLRPGAVLHSLPHGAFWRHAKMEMNNTVPLVHRTPSSMEQPRLILLGYLK